MKFIMLDGEQLHIIPSYIMPLINFQKPGVTINILVFGTMNWTWTSPVNIKGGTIW